MWRFPIIALVLSSALAAHAQAGSNSEVSAAVTSAMHGTVAATGKGGLGAQARLHAVELQLGGAVAAVQAAVPGMLAAIEPIRWPKRRDAGIARQDDVTSPVAGASSRGGSGLSYPLSNAMSLGLRYWFLTDEDLADLEMAETGSLQSGYMNHRFLVRARWHF